MQWLSRIAHVPAWLVKIAARWRAVLGFVVAAVTLSMLIFAAGRAAGNDSAAAEIATVKKDTLTEIERVANSVDRVRDRVEQLEKIPNRLDRMTERLGEVAGELKALRVFFGVPKPPEPGGAP